MATYPTSTGSNWWEIPASARQAQANRPKAADDEQAAPVGFMGGAQAPSGQSFYANTSSSGFMGGAPAPGRALPNTATTSSNNLTQANGSWYDMGDYDYQRAVPSYAKGPVWKDGRYGFYRTGSYGKENFTPFSVQPKQTSAPPTPGQLQRDAYTKEQQDAMDEAKRQNEERYQQALANLEGVGTQQTADINTRFDSGRSAVNQSLVNSGLSGTTVLPSMQRGVERERQDALNRLAAMLAREKNEVILGRNDLPPELSMYADLMYRTGAGGVR